MPLPSSLVGVGARALFVLVKPFALWMAIRLDSDAGLQLSQAYLFGVLVLALCGTNAHRKFYVGRFGEKQAISRMGLARLYKLYVRDLTLQVATVVAVLSVVGSIVSGFSMLFLFLGLVFGIAEKISDEEIRYTQFRRANWRLLAWAFAKVVASVTAVGLSFAFNLDIGISFPLLLLLSAIVLSGANLRFAVGTTVSEMRQVGIAVIGQSLGLLRRDWAQIGWTVAAMSLMYADRWFLQGFHQDIFPRYMLATQIAAGLLVAQTMLILAPARVDLVNRSPWSLLRLRLGSLLLTLVGLLVAIAIYLAGPEAWREGYLFVPFALGSIAVISAPYLERFYWVSKDWHRFATDVFFITLIPLGLSVQYAIWGAFDNLTLSFAWIATVLIARFCVISTYSQRTNFRLNRTIV